MTRHIHVNRQRVHLRGQRLGGAILLNSVEKSPEIQDGQSNKIVGIITPQVKSSMDGAGLLRNIHFGHHKKANKNDRIKFIF
jgi:hypothetical protein